MEPLKIFMIGVGGQGSLLAARILGESAMREGIDVVMSEIHGMSQRGGVVESVIVLGGLKSAMIRKGDADLLIAFEPNETLRAVRFCSAKTQVLINSRPIIPFTVSIGKTQYVSTDKVKNTFSGHVASVKMFDATSLAEKAGTSKASNIVVLGALIGLNLVPIKAKTLMQIIPDFVPNKYADINLAAFQMGMDAFM